MGSDYNRIRCEKCGWKGERNELRWVNPYKSSTLQDNTGYACPECGECEYIYMECVCVN